MLSPENERKLQQLFGRLNHEGLEAVYALATHLDEEATLRAVRCASDGALELGKEKRQISELHAGFHYGESIGTMKNANSIVSTIGQLMTCNIDEGSKRQTP